MGEALLRLGFCVLDLPRIRATCDAGNIASFRIMEGLGMRREAILPGARKGRDGLLYTIDQKTWQTQGPKARSSAYFR
jgi:RimJ/RimL family protein N-acetyltransferase